MLGIPKTVPSLLSGDMRDTAILGQLESLLGLEKAPLVGGLVSGALGTVAQTFRTWGSLWAMLPRGGVDIWGADDAIGAPDAVVVDAEEQTDHGDRARRATTADREPPADEPEPPPREDERTRERIRAGAARGGGTAPEALPLRAARGGGGG